MEENKGDKAIVILAWIAVGAVIAFCIRFNSKLY